MPAPSDILGNLSEITNKAIWVSLGWHIALGAALIALLSGVRPQRRVAAALLSAPLASVSALAFNFGNPFNGPVFALLAIILGVLALRAPPGRVALGRRWSVGLGGVLIAFGWVYPHFLEGTGALAYLYAAPLGAIPCPTLSVVIGTALAAGGFGLGAWRLLLAAAGCLYALVGALSLGVVIDIALLVGAVGLVAQYVQDRSGRGARRAGKSSGDVLVRRVLSPM